MSNTIRPPGHSSFYITRGTRSGNCYRRWSVLLRGIHQMLPALVAVVDQVTEAFHKGGVVRQANYPSGMWDGLERFTAGWFNNLLLQQWIPAMPKVQSKLERGVPVADVGCGRGRALIKLAQAFPNCHYFGFDVYGPAVEEASARAKA